MSDKLILDGDDDAGRRASRREVLKKLGIGAGVAWTAPVATGFLTQAAAAGTPAPTTTDTTLPPPICDCSGNPCGTTPLNYCDAISGCLCATTNSGACQCFIPICVAPGAGPCTMDDDCPSGYACVRECCGPPTCAPVCGTVLSPAHARAAQRRPWQRV